MAPIRSQDAELVFDVTQAKHSGPSPLGRGGGGDGGGGGGSGGGGSRAGAPKRVGTCRVSLRELADQREHDLPLTVLKKASWCQAVVDGGVQRHVQDKGSRTVPVSLFASK